MSPASSKVTENRIDAYKRIVLQPRKIELHRWLAWAQANLHATDAVVTYATTNAWVIYDRLVALVGRVVVAHPAKVKLIADARVKTDKVDVRTLAQLLRADMRERGLGPTAACAPVARATLAQEATSLAPDHREKSAPERAAPPQPATARRRTVCLQAARLVGRTRTLSDRALALGPGSGDTRAHRPTDRGH